MYVKKFICGICIIVMIIVLCVIAIILKNKLFLSANNKDTYIEEQNVVKSENIIEDIQEENNQVEEIKEETIPEQENINNESIIAPTEQEKTTKAETKKYDKNKPVIFIGYYQLSNNIEDKYAVKKDSVAGKIINYTSKKAKKSYTYTTCQTSISSYISWSIYSFSSANVELKKFFNSCGYDFKLGSNKQFEEATKKYINIPSYNDSGYILDTGDYIVVKVGNYTPNFYEFLYE